MEEKKVIEVYPELYKISDDKTVYLKGAKCKVCGYEYFPSQEYCPECLKKEYEEFLLPNEGIVYTYAKIITAPAGFQGPYYLGTGQFGNFRLYGMIVGSDDVKIGDKLKVIVGKLKENDEEIYTGYQFEIIKEGK